MCAHKVPRWPAAHHAAAWRCTTFLNLFWGIDMKNAFILATVIASAALVACGKKEEAVVVPAAPAVEAPAPAAQVPVTPAPAVETPAAQAPAAENIEQAADNAQAKIEGAVDTVKEEADKAADAAKAEAEKAAAEAKSAIEAAK